MKCPHCDREVRLYLSPYLCLVAQGEDGQEMSDYKAHAKFVEDFIAGDLPGRAQRQVASAKKLEGKK